MLTKFMIIISQYIYLSNHYVLYGLPETNTMSYINYISIKQRKIKHSKV